MARIGVVGAGRVGAVLAAALQAAGHQITGVGGESDATRTRIELLLPGVEVLKPTAVARGAEVLLLTVPDDVLDNVVTMLSAAGAIRAGQLVVHTSGRHGADVLRPAAARGARVAAMHPAMTFTGTEADLDRLPGTAFGCTADHEVRPQVQALVDDLGGRVRWIPESERVLYHAALAHGSNHLVTLVSQARELLLQAGIDDPQAVLRPLLEAALDNALEYGDAALTGPVVRGDIETIRGHLAVLADGPPERFDSYLAMARATAEHAVRDGRLLPHRAARIVGLLDAAERSVSR